jgi:hypothetical protein
LLIVITKAWEKPAFDSCRSMTFHPAAAIDGMRKTTNQLRIGRIILA